MIIKVKNQKGFTIIELLVVMVVIGILAAITVVSYSGIVQRAIVASLQSDLKNAFTKLDMYYIEHEVYPNGLDDADIANDGSFEYHPSDNGSTYSLFATKEDLKYTITNSSATASVAVPIVAVVEGGGSCSSNNGYQICKFASNGTFKLTDGSGTVELLVVAGGGAAGDSISGQGGPGGGGAGGLTYKPAYFIGPLSSIDVTIGAGGPIATNANGKNGGDSSFGPIIAKGGGGGAKPNLDGLSGGSGGGGGSNGNSSTTVKNGGNGVSGQGQSGGKTNVATHYGAGGGGAGGVGGNTILAPTKSPGPGGLGLSYDISGTAVTYSTGGRGGSYLGPAASSSPNVGKGGDAGYGGSTNPSYAGGSGVVIVKYKT